MLDQESTLSKIKNKHILIDGDIVKYRCAASAEKTKYLVEFPYNPEMVIKKDYEHYETHKEAMSAAGKLGIIWSRREVQPLEFALQACKTAIESLLAKLEPSKVSVFLSPDRTFRHDIARTKPYKGNRTQPKPKYLKEVEQYLVKQYDAVFGVNVEADDEIGVALSKDPTGAVSVSIDKDLLQVAGWHYNWVNDTVQKVTPREADFSFYTQMLTGDVTDNIPGIAGLGPKGAAQLLNGATSSTDLCSRVWNVYRGEFNDTQKARDYFFEQSKLLWVLRFNPALSHGDRIWTQGFIPPIELK